jgi:hypothetical protein
VRECIYRDFGATASHTLSGSRILNEATQDLGSVCSALRMHLHFTYPNYQTANARLLKNARLLENPLPSPRRHIPTSSIVAPRCYHTQPPHVRPTANTLTIHPHPTASSYPAPQPNASSHHLSTRLFLIFCSNGNSTTAKHHALMSSATSTTWASLGVI